MKLMLGETGLQPYQNRNRTRTKTKSANEIVQCNPSFHAGGSLSNSLELSESDPWKLSTAICTSED